MKNYCGVALILAGSVMPAPSAAAAAPPPKRARPPQFSKAISDVFFRDANARLVGKRPEKAVSPDPPDPAAPAPPTPVPAEGATARNAAWSKLISAEAIEDEIKSEQMRVGEAVESATKFKGGGYQQARASFSVLAVMFAIDAQYDGTLRWKREATGLRDLMARAGFNCKVGTDSSYKEARLRQEDLQGLVRGSSPQVAATELNIAWNKVADRPPLMKRLEQAQQQVLLKGTANQGDFARQAGKISHEAQVIAALAAVISREGYEFADDQTYREFAAAMQAQALAVRTAVEQNDYEQARQAVGMISKSCSGCHEGFRN